MASDQLIGLWCNSSKMLPFVFLLVLQFLNMSQAQAREFCQADGYWCDTGHCCGSGECCTYYYELWWFWLVWFLIVFIIGFCVWQRKRLHPWRDNRCERTCSIQDIFLGRGFNFADITPVPPCKLPSYSEIGETVSYDTPPPPYNVQSATPACLSPGEGPSTSLPAGEYTRCPPPHRGIEAITNGSSLSSLNSTPSPSDNPPSYSQIIGSPTPVFSSMTSSQITPQITPQYRSSMATQFPEQTQTQTQESEQQNQNNSGCSTAVNSPSTPVSTQLAPGVVTTVATCACGSPLRSPAAMPPQARLLPPSVPSSPKPTVVTMSQRPQRFLSPQGSPTRFTTRVVTPPSPSNHNRSNSGNTERTAPPSSNAGTPVIPPRPGSVVRTSSTTNTNQGSDRSNGQTVVDMRSGHRRFSFISRLHLR